MRTSKIIFLLSLTFAVSALAKPGQVGSADGSRVYADCDDDLIKEIRVDGNLHRFEAKVNFRYANFFGTDDLQTIKFEKSASSEVYEKGIGTPVQAKRMKKFAKANVGQLGSPHACSGVPKVEPNVKVKNITPHEIVIGFYTLDLTSGKGSCQPWGTMPFSMQIICKRK